MKALHADHELSIILLEEKHDMYWDFLKFQPQEWHYVKTFAVSSSKQFLEHYLMQYTKRQAIGIINQ